MRSYLTQNTAALKNTCIRYFTSKAHFSKSDFDISNLSVFTIDSHKYLLDKLGYLRPQSYFNRFYDAVLNKNRYNLLRYKKRLTACFYNQEAKKEIS